MKKKKKGLLLKIINFMQIPVCVFIIYSFFTSKLIPEDIRLYLLVGGSALAFIWILVIFILLIKKKLAIALIMMILSVLIYGGSFYILMTTWAAEGTIANITENNEMQVSSIFVTTSDSIKTVENFAGKTIGLLSNKEDYEGHIIPLEKLEEDGIECDIEYVTSYLALMSGLVDGDYDIIALPKDYADRFEVNDSFRENYKDFIIILNIEKMVPIKESDIKEIKDGEPFTIALIGTDSALERHHHNYDTIILITFHPETKDLVVTSVYRATGMYSSCIGGMDLVNHNGWKGWGPECLKETIEDFWDIDINHYIMIDFKGFVELVDNIGGITVEVPKDIKEQDSDRNWGSHTIYLKEGIQTLGGEEALAFARHRKSYEGNGGIVRSENHVKVIEAVADKIISTDLIFKFKDLLEILEDNMETDMSETQLFGLYDMLLDVVKDMGYDMDQVNIISRTVDAYGAMLYSPAMNTVVGMGKIYADSYWDVYDALHAVTKNETRDTSYFSFDLSEDPDYVEPKFLDSATQKALKIVPYDPRVMPNLVGKTESSAHSYVSKYLYFSVSVSYAYSDTVEKGYIISQSIPSGVRLNHAFRLSVTVSKGPSTPAEASITLPDMAGWTRTQVQTWANNNGLSAWNFQRVDDPAGYSNNIYMYADAATEAAGVVYPSKAVTFYIAIITDTACSPSISLTGEISDTLEVGEAWAEPGYSAWDDVDWVITNEVVKTGSVDTSTAGTYILYYDVSNSQGTAALQKTRTITVEEPE